MAAAGQRQGQRPGQQPGLIAHSKTLEAAKAIQLFDDVRAMTWRLLHPKP